MDIVQLGYRCIHSVSFYACLYASARASESCRGFGIAAVHHKECSYKVSRLALEEVGLAGRMTADHKIAAAAADRNSVAAAHNLVELVVEGED